MAKKTAWHTDIVVKGKGFGLAVKQREDGEFMLAVKPDMRSTKGAFKAFREALRKTPGATTITEAKSKVEQAIKATRARWNRWHRESY